MGNSCCGPTVVLGESKGITWPVMAKGHSLVLSPSRAVLVNGLLHGSEIEADESTDGTELI